MLATIAWAQNEAGSPGGATPFLTVVPFVLVFVVFYFLLIRPQRQRQKQARAMLEALKKGDKVVTTSGIWGTVTNMGKHTVTLQVADNTKVKIQRDGISRLRSDEEE